MQFVHHNRIYCFGYSTEQTKLNLRLYSPALVTAHIPQPHASVP